MKGFVKFVLSAVLLNSTVPSLAANTLQISPQERAKIEEVVHQYLINKPEVLMEAIQALQNKQVDQAEKTIKATQKVASSFATPLFHQNKDPIAGNPNGKVTIVEFFDYQCPHCNQMPPVMDAIIKANPDVRIVYKEFPIRGPVSQFAAKAALAAHLQGKYGVFSHALLTAAAKEALTEDGILKIAQQSGLNVAQLTKDMHSATIADQLQTIIKLGQDLKLFGTPAFFIANTATTNPGNINYVPGQMNQQQMQAAIDQAIK